MSLCRVPLIISGLVAVGLAVSGCVAPRPAAQVAAGEESFNDPLEDTNRAIFGFNQAVDRNVLLPVAKTYRTVVLPPVRESFHDFLQNLNGPLIFANDVLQGQFGLASETFARLAINTTIGFAGMFDAAKAFGIPPHSNDFGITLGTWGVDEGPYLMVPVLGPSNPRDLAAQVGEGFADPANRIAAAHRIWYLPIIRAGISGIDE